MFGIVSLERSTAKFKPRPVDIRRFFPDVFQGSFRPGRLGVYGAEDPGDTNTAGFAFETDDELPMQKSYVNILLPVSSPRSNCPLI